MAKSKLNMAPRVPPEWTKQRTSVTLRASPAMIGYYGLHADTKFSTWHDVYGAFRQGARVRS